MTDPTSGDVRSLVACLETLNSYPDRVVERTATEAASLLEALLSRLEREKWQSIDTVPDNVEFLAGWWFQGRWVTTVAKYRTRPSGAKEVEARTGWRIYPVGWCHLPDPPSPHGLQKMQITPTSSAEGV